jgi:hypothetical protein
MEQATSRPADDQISSPPWRTRRRPSRGSRSGFVTCSRGPSPRPGFRDQAVFVSGPAEHFATTPRRQERYELLPRDGPDCDASVFAHRALEPCCPSRPRATFGEVRIPLVVQQTKRCDITQSRQLHDRGNVAHRLVRKTELARLRRFRSGQTEHRARDLPVGAIVPDSRVAALVGTAGA